MPNQSFHYILIIVAVVLVLGNGVIVDTDRELGTALLDKKGGDRDSSCV